MQPVLIDLTQWGPSLLLREAFSQYKGFVFALAALIAVALYLANHWATQKGKSVRFLNGIMMAGLLLGVLLVAMMFPKINSYGLMLALGFMVSISVARWRARRCGESGDVITTLGILCLIGGVVGARLSWAAEEIAKNSPDAPRTLGGILNVTSGGLVFDGGLILASLLVLGYMLKRRLPLRRYLDILAISAMIGLSFGRVGCLLNGCCYGATCKEDFPLAIHFPYAASPAVYPHRGENPYPAGTNLSPVYGHQLKLNQLLDIPPALQIRQPGEVVRVKLPEDLRTPAEFQAAREAHSLAVQPAQVYGLLNALILVGLLSLFFRLRNREGQVFALLFILYPIGRFVLEMIRDDNHGMALTPAQWKCILLLAFGVGLMLLLRRLPASAGPTWNDRLAAEEARTQEPGPRNQGRRKA